MSGLLKIVFWLARINRVVQEMSQNPKLGLDYAIYNNGKSINIHDRKEYTKFNDSWKSGLSKSRAVISSLAY